MSFSIGSSFCSDSTKTKHSVFFRCLISLALALGVASSLSLAAPSEADAATGSVTYYKKVTEGYDTVGYFEINGQLAFCAQHSMTTPAVGSPCQTIIENVSNQQARKVLYYGWGGPGDLGFSRVVTTIALSTACGDYGGRSGDALINAIASKPNPASGFIVKSWSTNAGKTQTLMTWTNSQSGTINLFKTSSNPSITDGKSDYSLAGAVYAIYPGSGGSGMVGNLITDSKGQAVSGPLPYGSYKVVERTAPKGYELDTTVHWVTVGGSVNVLRVSDKPIYTPPEPEEPDDPDNPPPVEEPKPGYLQIVKQSTNGSVSDGTTCYDLAGAVYSIYSDDGSYVSSVTTDSMGLAGPVELELGSYYFVETTAPTGFAIDTTQHPFVIETEGAYEYVYTEDVPQLNPLDIVLNKTDSETNTSVPQGNASLANAQFVVKFYDGYFSSAYETNGLYPKYTWRVYTDESGRASIPNSQLPDNGVGGRGLPLGTVTIQEVISPVGHLTNDDIFVKQITSQGTDEFVYTYNAPTVPEQIHRSDISLMKFGETSTDEDENPEVKTPLAGVEFDIINSSDRSVQRLDGTTAAVGDIIYTIRTDDQGWASTETLHAAGSKCALPYGTYTIHEREETVPAGYKHIQNFDVTVTEDAKVYHYILEDKTGTAIQMLKQDAETGKQISGYTTFRILDKDKNILTFTSHYPNIVVHSSFTTNADGSCILPEKLMAGQYYLQEIEAPFGYVLSEDLIPFTVDGSTVNTWDSPLKVIINDTAQKGTISVIKTDAETEKPVLVAGAVFDITATNDIVTPDGTVRATAGMKVATITTDNTGKAVSPPLYLGDYTVTEVHAPYGYLLNVTSVNTTIHYAGQNVAITNVDETLSNMPAKGVINIVKQDVETGKPVLLEGAVFNIVAKNDVATGDGTIRAHAGDVVDTVTTNEEGTCSTKELYLGEYQVIETQAPYGYVLDTTPRDITLVYADENTPIVYESVVMTNMAQKGTVNITKIDAETDKPVLVAGAEFDITATNDIVTPDGTVRAAAGTKVATITTDETGKAVSAPLYLGDYTVTEVHAPSGYILNNVSIDVTLEYAGQDITITNTDGTIGNMPAKGIINIVKQDIETGKPVLLEGAIFDVVAKNDVVTGDGTIRAHAGDIVDTVTTNKEGVCATKELYLGEYQVIETQAPYGYVLDTEPRDIVLTYVDENTPVVYETVAMTDITQKGTISIFKTDSLTGSAVEGAVYDVFSDEDIATGDGTIRFNKGDKVDSITTDVDGKAISIPLYLGAYSIVETQQPDGYLLDKETHHVVLEYAGQEIEITNIDQNTVNVPTEIDLHKTRMGSDTPLEGIDFGYWNKTDEFVINAEDGGGKIAVQLDESDATQIESVKAVAVDAENGAKEDNGKDEQNKPLDSVKAYNLTLNEHGFYESEALPFGSYNVVIEYVYNDAAPIETKILENNSNIEKIIASETDDKATTDNVVEETKAENDKQKQNKPKDDLRSETIAMNVSISKDTPLALYETIASTGMDTNTDVVTNWYTKTASAFVPSDKVTFAKTDKEGDIITRYLAPGTYGFAEYRTLPGYVLDRTAQYITIDADGRIDGNDVGILAFENDYTKIQISKTDLVSGKELPGATLELYGTDEAPIETWVSTEEPHMIDTLPVGEYTLHEEIAPDGYLLSEDVVFRVLETGDIQKVEMKDDYTKLDVIKVDSDTKDALREARLALKDEKGAYIDIRNYIEDKNVKLEEIVFDEDGQILGSSALGTHENKLLQTTFSIAQTVNSAIGSEASVNAEKSEETARDNETKESESPAQSTVYCWVSNDTKIRFNGLEPGMYSLVEISAPARYQIADDVQFSVEGNGTIKEITMEDQFVPVEVFDKTGKTLPLLVLAGAGVVLLGIVGGLFIRRKLV